MKQIFKTFKIFIFLLIITSNINIAYSISTKCETAQLKEVRYKQRNIFVKNLQYCLKEIGYEINSKEIGFYGSSTMQAVKKFYRDHAKEIFELAKKTNTLWQIKNWSGRKIGMAGITVLKNKIKTLSPSSKSSVVSANYLSLLIQLLLKLAKEKLQATTTALTTPMLSTATLTSYQIGGGGGAVITGGSQAVKKGDDTSNYPQLGFIIKNSDDIKTYYSKRLNQEEILLIGQIRDNGILLVKFKTNTTSQDFGVFLLENITFEINEVIEYNGNFYILGSLKNGNFSPILIKISNNQINWAYNYNWSNKNISCSKLEIYGNLLHLYCTLEDFPPGLSSGLLMLINLDGELIDSYYYSNENNNLDIGLRDILRLNTPDSGSLLLLVDVFNNSNSQKGICLWRINQNNLTYTAINKSLGLISNYLVSGIKIFYLNNYIYLIGNVLESNYLNIVLNKIDSNFNLIFSKIYRANNIKIPQLGLTSSDSLYILGNFQDNFTSNSNLFYSSINSNGNINFSKIYRNPNYNTYALNFSFDINDNLLVHSSISQINKEDYKSLIFNIKTSGNVNFSSSSNFVSENLNLTTSDFTGFQIFDCNPQQIGNLNPAAFQKRLLQFVSSSTTLFVEKIIE